MPACRDGDAATENLPASPPAPQPEWREPPGLLGIYVRRVKHLSRAAHSEPDPAAP